MGILLQLFISFATVGLFCVGGGYASMPLIQAEVIDIHGWLTMNEFVDIFTLSRRITIFVVNPHSRATNPHQGSNSIRTFVSILFMIGVTHQVPTDDFINTNAWDFLF